MGTWWATTWKQTPKLTLHMLTVKSKVLRELGGSHFWESRVAARRPYLSVFARWYCSRFCCALQGWFVALGWCQLRDICAPFESGTGVPFFCLHFDGVFLQPCLHKGPVTCICFLCVISSPLPQKTDLSEFGAPCYCTSSCCLKHHFQGQPHRWFTHLLTDTGFCPTALFHYSFKFSSNDLMPRWQIRLFVG